MFSQKLTEYHIPEILFSFMLCILLGGINTFSPVCHCPGSFGNFNVSTVDKSCIFINDTKIVYVDKLCGRDYYNDIVALVFFSIGIIVYFITFCVMLILWIKYH
jgi:hypothetical protein